MTDLNKRTDDFSWLVENLFEMETRKIIRSQKLPGVSRRTWVGSFGAASCAPHRSEQHRLIFPAFLQLALKLRLIPFSTALLPAAPASSSGIRG